MYILIDIDECVFHGWFFFIKSLISNLVHKCVYVCCSVAYKIFLKMVLLYVLLYARWPITECSFTLYQFYLNLLLLLLSISITISIVKLLNIISTRMRGRKRKKWCWWLWLKNRHAQQQNDIRMDNRRNLCTRMSIVEWTIANWKQRLFAKNEPKANGYIKHEHLFGLKHRLDLV